MELVFGHNEIIRIDSQIRKVLDFFNTIDLGSIWNYRNKIEDMGFEHKNSSGHAFLGKRQVIKYAYTCGPPPASKFRVPTLIYSNRTFKQNRDWSSSYVVMIQPRVKPLPKHMRVCDVMDKLREDIEIDHGAMQGGYRFDIHSGNIGLYRNRVALFDW